MSTRVEHDFRLRKQRLTHMGSKNTLEITGSKQLKCYTVPKFSHEPKYHRTTKNNLWYYTRDNVIVLCVFPLTHSGPTPQGPTAVWFLWPSRDNLTFIRKIYSSSVNLSGRFIIFPLRWLDNRSEIHSQLQPITFNFSGYITANKHMFEIHFLLSGATLTL